MQTLQTKEKTPIMHFPEILQSNNLASIAIFLLTVTLVRKFVLSRGKLPPGPWGWPFIGHLPLMMVKDKREVFRKLMEQYGNLVYLCVGRQPILLVGGHEMIHEVLVKRGKDFDSRPQVFTTLKTGQGKGIVNSSGSVWSEHRHFLLNTMKTLGIGRSTFEGNVTQEIVPFLQVIKSHSGRDYNCHHIIQTAMSNIVCSIAFGKRFEYEEKEFEQLLTLVGENMKLAGSTSLVNYFPFLEYFPGDPLQCQLNLDTVRRVQKVTRGWVERHKETLDPHEPRDIIDLYIIYMQRKASKDKSTYFDDDQLVKFVGDLFVAGTETTATTLEWSLVFLVRHPEVQNVLYQEIVSTLGDRDSLNIHDKDKMPYTMATISECQRLADIAPFCLPHSNPQTVELNGYTIPKGTMVVPVLNSLHHDSNLWENPMELKPERFLDKAKSRYVSQKAFQPFASGVRCCPGRSLALMELFFFITSIVQHFHIMPSQSEGVPSLEGHIGVTYVPKSRSFVFMPRRSQESCNLSLDGSIQSTSQLR